MKDRIRYKKRYFFILLLLVPIVTCVGIYKSMEYVDHVESKPEEGIIDDQGTSNTQDSNTEKEQTQIMFTSFRSAFNSALKSISQNSYTTKVNGLMTISKGNIYSLSESIEGKKIYNVETGVRTSELALLKIPNASYGSNVAKKFVEKNGKIEITNADWQGQTYSFGQNSTTQDETSFVSGWKLKPSQVFFSCGMNDLKSFSFNKTSYGYILNAQFKNNEFVDDMVKFMAQFMYPDLTKLNIIYDGFQIEIQVDNYGRLRNVKASTSFTTDLKAIGWGWVGKLGGTLSLSERYTIL